MEAGFDQQRLILVSNGEPYQHVYGKKQIEQQKLAGGLTTGLDPLMQAEGGIWIAWGRGEADFEVLDQQNKVKVPDKTGYTLKRVELAEAERDNFYYGFANEVMWPVCHGFIDKANFKPQYWKSYQQVNKKYGASILEELQADDLVWIHDYHLALVPDILKKQSESVKLAFFWHIPWPDWNSFRTIPWRNEILSAMLKSDFIAFHTQSFVDNFLRCAKKLGMEVDFEEQLVFNQGHQLKVTSIPLGIDYQGFEELVASPDYRQKVAQIKDDYQTDKLVFAVDRLDYTKGIEERLDAINEFFASYPYYQGKVTFVQRIAPSRTQVAEYQQMKQQIDEKVAAINGKYQQDDWIPIKYFYGSVPQADLLPYYKAADLALITPLIDGMNLVAKEYLAVQEDGVLLLSEFAGAAEYLSNAIQINPYHTAEVAAAIFEALEMPSKAKQDRLQAAKTKLKKYDINWWRDHFIDSWLACYE